MLGGETGSYLNSSKTIRMSLSTSVNEKSKKNRDNMCLKWALRAHLFPVRRYVDRTTSYPTNDGLNFTGIDFPTPVSQIGKLERQNPGTAINVFEWDKDEVIVHRLSDLMRTRYGGLAFLGRQWTNCLTTA